MNKKDIESKFEALLTEFDLLINKEDFFERFLSWYIKAEKTISNIFGDESKELKEFKEHKFKIIPTNFKNRINNVVREMIDIIDIQKDDVKYSENNFVREQLYEFREIIVGIKICIK